MNDIASIRKMRPLFFWPVGNCIDAGFEGSEFACTFEVASAASAALDFDLVFFGGKRKVYQVSGLMVPRHLLPLAMWENGNTEET